MLQVTRSHYYYYYSNKAAVREKSRVATVVWKGQARGALAEVFLIYGDLLSEKCAQLPFLAAERLYASTRRGI